MNIEERTLLVNLSITVWSAYKTDNEVTQEITDRKKAKKGAGKFRKRLMGKGALDKISKISSSARNTHNVMTLPWNDNGTRIITIEAYQKHLSMMRQYRIEMQDAVKEFAKDYKEHVKQAKEDLAELFKPEDYPPVEEVISKFSLDVEPSSVPVSSDFRAKVSNDDVKTITKDIEKRMQMRINDAMKDVWERIAKLTKRMAERLENYQPRVGLMDAENTFHASLVNNIRELAGVLPTLNIANDPKLITVHKELVDHLCQFDATELRTDERARRKTARKAKSIYDKVSKYMN